MDTKLKKSKGISGFIAGILAFWLFFSVIASVPYLIYNQALEPEYSSTGRFRRMIFGSFYEGTNIVTYAPVFDPESYYNDYYNGYYNGDGTQIEPSEEEKAALEQEFKAQWQKDALNALSSQRESFYYDREARLVFFENTDKDAIQPQFTNTDFDSVEELITHLDQNPEEYHYYFIWRDGQATVFGQGEHRFYQNLTAAMEREMDSPPVTGEDGNITAVIAIKEDVGAYGAYNNRAYDVYYGHTLARQLLLAAAFGLGATVILFAVAIAFRRDRLLVAARFAGVLGKVWLEVKLLVYAFAVAIGMGAFGMSFDMPAFCLAVPLVFFTLYLIALDLKHNGLAVFANNAINSLYKAISKYTLRYPFQKRQSRKMSIFIGIEIGLCFFVVLFFSIGVYDGPFLIFLALLFAFVGILVAYRFLINYRKSLKTLEHIMDSVRQLRMGSKVPPITLYPTDDLYAFAEDLNGLGDGITKMVAERTQSERMKVELITNVSHDLKTPLTSIITYVALLEKEELSPGYANDYVKILDQKAVRLKTLIEDLFEVSKANSGNMEVQMTVIDFGELIEQTLAELDEKIAPSGLEFRVSLPGERLHINADGRRLHRVLSNLIINALNYSLPGTRVYINVFEWQKKVLFVIKNVASYEMNFTSEEISERFVRGDKARSTEGSGLGLSIAKSFTEAQDGKMDIEVDGDLFKVTLEFDAQPTTTQTIDVDFPSEPPKELQQ